MAEKRTDAIARQPRNRAVRREALQRRMYSVRLMQVADQIDQMLDDFGIGRSRMSR
jgi:hypothetical protein